MQGLFDKDGPKKWCEAVACDVELPLMMGKCNIHFIVASSAYAVSLDSFSLS